jgi:hypothetical protein
MQLGAVLEATILYTAPDGRTVFRPWGAKGPCYLVNSKHRRRFALFVRIYYSLMLLLCLGVPFLFGPRAIYLAAALWTAGFYLAFWVLSRGLPKTEPPPRPTPAQRDASLKRLAGQLGTPALWLLLVMALVMVAAGIFVLVHGYILVGTVALVFFGGAAGVFAWWLRRAHAA